MLIVASLSGIQEFLFDVREAGGGQARSLRHRSFRIQWTVECVAERLMDVVRDCGPNRLFCAAAKVAIETQGMSDAEQQAVHATAAEINAGLLNETHGRLRLAVAITPLDGPFANAYEKVNRSLSLAKMRPFAPATGAESGAWKEGGLVANGVYDAEAEAKRDADVGRQLVNGRWLIIERPDGSARNNPMDAAGLHGDLCPDAPTPSGRLLSCSNLADPDTPPLGDAKSVFRVRRLARHIPRDDQGDPVEFVALADRSRGWPLLGVLKADVDSLGRAISEALQTAGTDGRAALCTLSGTLDHFFAEGLEAEKQRDPWNLIYTVFAGGDDMLVVGPWDIVLDFAGHMRGLFEKRFGSTAPERPCTSPLTISAGIAMIKPKYPVHIAAQQADDLLDSAKRKAAPGSAAPKDQCAALGGVWKWADHNRIIADGKRLANWVDAGILQRGWLHTLLELMLLRRGEAGPEYTGVAPEIATSRLAYHVARNWPQRQDNPRSDKERDGNAARKWINGVLKDFDTAPAQARERVKYLAAIIRYAILATRADSTREGRG